MLLRNKSQGVLCVVTKTALPFTEFTFRKPTFAPNFPFKCRCLYFIRQKSHFSSEQHRFNTELRKDISREIVEKKSSNYHQSIPRRMNHQHNDQDQRTKELGESILGVADIEDLHKQAILKKQSTYIDPTTGFTVFTELAHLKRGKCCGNMCRHCPYGYSNVMGIDGTKTIGKAISGDKDGTGRLVRRILDGTYFNDHETADEEHNAICLVVENEFDCSNDRSKSDNQLSYNANVMLRGQGGSAGGTLTLKNVPYTRKGDTGISQLFTGECRKKDDTIFEAMGTVDELCSVIGAAYAYLTPRNAYYVTNSTESSKTLNSPDVIDYGDLPEQLLEVMSRLFDVGSHIARPMPKQKQEETATDNKAIGAFYRNHTNRLEEWIDTMTEQLPELTSFILPTGSPASAHLHIARTVCRRAERRMVPLIQGDEACDPAVLVYVNRLSDYLFTASRYVNYCEGRDEIQYRREKHVNEVGCFHRETVAVKLK